MNVDMLECSVIYNWAQCASGNAYQCLVSWNDNYSVVKNFELYGTLTIGFI